MKSSLLKDMASEKKNDKKSYVKLISDRFHSENLAPCILVTVIFAIFVYQFYFNYFNGIRVIEHSDSICIRLSIYFMLTLLCSLFAFLFKDHLYTDDVKNENLKFAYVSLLIGTVFFCASEFSGFLLHEKCLADCFFSIGNVYFYCMHIAFLFRHKKKAVSGKYYSIALIVCSIVTVIYLVLYFNYFHHEENQFWVQRLLIISCVIYAIIILSSLIVAYKTWKLCGEGKLLNTFLIITGYTSFAVCEIIVASGIMSDDSMSAFISSAVSSLFYTPAFLLLAMSGLKIWERKKLKIFIIVILSLIAVADIVFIRLLNSKFEEMDAVGWINWIPVILLFPLSFPIVYIIINRIKRT